MPSLDSDLLSTTRHARNGKRYTFLLGDSQIHLTFPEFSVICPIPADGDLRLDLYDLTERNWDLPDFICNGIEEDITISLETLEVRMKILNHVSCGRNITTRNQRKLQIEQLKQALGLVSTEFQDDLEKSRENSNEESEKSRNNSREEFCETVLPDRYLCEGSPDKLMLEALKELNINDLKDILRENESPDKHFQKEE